MTRRVFLVGFMGSGKSSFGRRLAAHTGWDFVDTDAEIEQRAGMSVSEIFSTRGEQFFRELEEEVIGEITVGTPTAATTAMKTTVFALGGGAVCRDGAMEHINASGTTFYLRMPPDRLVKRMSEHGRARRPKIAGMNDAQLLAYIQKTLPEREKFYKMANFVVECGGRTDAQILEQILEKL